MMQLDSPHDTTSPHASRNKMIAAIYETVLKPELYDEFMQAWSDHVQSAVAELEDLRAGQEQAFGVCDPDLQQHFIRAFEILEQIGRNRSAGQPMSFVSDSPRFAIAFGADGRVCAASRTAQGFAHEPDGLQRLKDRLSADSVVHLDTLLQACQTPEDRVVPRVLVTDTTPSHLIARCFVPDAGQEPPVLVIEAVEMHWSVQVEDMLTSSFALTPAELEVMHNLVSGHRLRDIAEMTGRSEHTVRNQLKSAQNKTGARSQVELVRLVAFLAKDRDRDDRDPAITLSDAQDRVHWLTSVEGRSFEVFEFGDPEGRPVLFLHGMLDSVAVLRLNNAVLAQRGWRVLAPIRPGFGQSEPLAQKAAPIDAAIDQVRAVLAQFELTTVPVLGHLAGALYAHAAAKALPDRVRGILNVSGGVPIRSLRLISSMAPRQQLVAFTVRFAKPVLPAILRAGIAQIDSEDVQAFISALYAPETKDSEVIEALKLDTAMMEAFRFSVLQGQYGFHGDSMVIAGDWSAHVAPFGGPILHLHGLHDPVVSADSVQRFAQDFAQVNLRILPDCGQLLFYQKPDTVLDALDSLVTNKMAAAS